MISLNNKPFYKVVAAFIEKNNKFLLVRRPPGKKNEGLWEFPGGKVEEGETLEEALKRELKEELGIEVLKCTFLEKIFYDYGDFKIELFAFKVNDFRGELKLKEALDYQWIDLNFALKLNLCNADRKLIKKLLELKSFYSDKLVPNSS